MNENTDFFTVQEYLFSAIKHDRKTHLKISIISKASIFNSLNQRTDIQYPEKLSEELNGNVAENSSE